MLLFILMMASNGPILHAVRGGSTSCMRSLENAGLLLAEEKCSWTPVQQLTWLSHVIISALTNLFQRTPDF